jgi:hypothetical protein
VREKPPIPTWLSAVFKNSGIRRPPHPSFETAYSRPSDRPLPADGPLSECEFQTRGHIGLRSRKSPFRQTGNALSEYQSNFRRGHLPAHRLYRWAAGAFFYDGQGGGDQLATHTAAQGCQGRSSLTPTDDTAQPFYPGRRCPVPRPTVHGS